MGQNDSPGLKLPIGHNILILLNNFNGWNVKTKLDIDIRTKLDIRTFNIIEWIQ